MTKFVTLNDVMACIPASDRTRIEKKAKRDAAALDLALSATPPQKGVARKILAGTFRHKHR